jgi:peptidoglycan/LPS O-acetylase OafA/YrhL
MVFLGSMSYAMYILQFPVYQICQKYLPWFKDHSPEQIFFPYLLVLFASATLAYFFIEKPARSLWMRI